ncbi:MULTISPECIES: single-stranded DNA-binding protein [Metabacillus]|uniref:single-stranded DNA-binding protein n=1 Tax=Metabacillus TaxID=2675233 RepID=UPI000C7FAE77|nr:MULTISPECIES: single-stranded DNA-binding protein [Metabacillus]MCM3443951.1 single-stranded DNA-binding protein [Metabacillus halosaccharovorans]PMC34996.1 single-stranded DNA-binding protein [Bacillus sp. UMB0899]
MLNRVVLVGRLVKNPDLRYTSSGVAVATFTLAVNRTFTNQQGEREADFLNCVVWRKQAESTANFLKKGSLAGVDGRLQSRSYEDQTGKRVYVTEVVAETVQFLDVKGSGNGNQDGNQENNNTNQNNNRNQSQNNNNSFGDPFSNAIPYDIPDDDLPF